MDAHDLLLSWPGFDQLDASAILAHPAWRMSIGYVEDGLSLVVNEAPPSRTDELLLKVTLDEEANILGISDSPRYPDLHRLWARRAELPEALIIALVEKEAGLLLQNVEKLMHGELRLLGLAEDAGEASSRRSFSLETPEDALGFSLCVPAEVERAIGVVDNLDPSHPSITSLVRGVRAEYATVVGATFHRRPLSPGDFIVLSDSSPAWKTEVPPDDFLRIMSAEESTFSFAQFASDALPPVPPPGALTLFRCGHPVATAEVSSVGDVPAVRITALLHS